MKIFVSWSGPRSAAVAEALKEYLPMINNAFDLWLSSEDITKGSRSTLEIAQALAAAKAGIICLTPNNLTAPWILFEAGSVAKTVDKTLACTLLIGLEPSDVSKPLGEFQHTRLNEKELLKLVKDLNSAAGESTRKDAEIDKAFKLCWPELRAKLEDLPSDGSSRRPERSERELLEELVDTMRSVRDQSEERIAKLQAELDSSVKLLAQQISRVESAIAPQTPYLLTTAAGLWNPTSANQPYIIGNPVIGRFGGEVFQPIVASATPETLAAQTLLKQAAQPDEVPPAKPAANAPGTLRRAAAKKNSTEKQADKK
ncbi:MAG: TIR domain-containing protein [Candidatus Sulfotelmatobacter sp.]